MRALIPESSGIGLARFLPRAKYTSLSFGTSSLRSRAPRLMLQKQPSGGPVRWAACPVLADIVAKVPKGAGLISRQRTKQAAVTDQQGFKRVTRIICEFYAWRRGPPHHYSIAAPTGENLSPTWRKDFCNNIGTNRTSDCAMSALRGKAETFALIELFRF